MIPSLNIDPSVLRGAAAAPQPDAPRQRGRGPTTRLATLSEVTHLPGGSPIHMPAHPALQVMSVRLAAGECFPVAEHLVQRHALVQQGELWVANRPGGRPDRHAAGDWVIDDGALHWAASDRGAVELLVVQHVRRAPLSIGAEGPTGGINSTDASDGEDSGEGAAGAQRPWATTRARAGQGRQARAEAAAAGHVAHMHRAAAGAAPSRDAAQMFMRLTTDYTGRPITLPDGPLRVMVNRCEIQPGATLQWLRHPHQRYVYVEQGQLQVENLAGYRQLYSPGEMLVEQRGVVHRATNCSQRTLSLIVFDYVPQAQRANAPL